ncbi:MAG: hypothetical protein K9G70_13725, partial [Prolixibacteraceae bacterium]|nr:hypothetical protein [Prolixibacteraceae bacterium]
PLSPGMGVRFHPERVSALKRNGCPFCPGMTVRFKTEWVTALLRILQLLFITNQKARKKHDNNILPVI